MDESNSGSQIPSAMAYVEGGIQDVCDDACSICLEPFCDSEPSTVSDRIPYNNRAATLSC